MSPKEVDLLHRAKELADATVGKRYRIEGVDTMGTEFRRVYEGVIIECGFARFRRTPRMVQVVFKIVMECGTNKVRREFFCRTLPR